MKLPGIRPNRVPKKKYLNSNPTMGDTTFTETFGTRGVNLRNRM